jgi:hypothetical protein
MKKVVERERNKSYYRILHVPIWIWVFFILPGHLTCALFLDGPDARHWVWLAVVVAVCVWRGALGRLPGVEEHPYIVYWGEEQANLLYRKVCYTAAWIDLLVPAAIVSIGLVTATFTGSWMLDWLFAWAFYPLAGLVVVGTLFDVTPRARRTTLQEGAERAWFYVALWTIVPAQVVAWGAWRFGRFMDLDALPLAYVRFVVFTVVTVALLALGLRGRLPRTARYYEANTS